VLEKDIEVGKSYEFAWKVQNSSESKNQDDMSKGYDTHVYIGKNGWDNRCKCVGKQKDPLSGKLYVFYGN